MDEIKNTEIINRMSVSLIMSINFRQGWKDVTNNAEQAMDVALLCFGRWAFGDVDNDNNWILLGSKVFKRNGQSFHLGSQMK